MALNASTTLDPQDGGLPNACSHAAVGWVAVQDHPLWYGGAIICHVCLLSLNLYHVAVSRYGQWQFGNACRFRYGHGKDVRLLPVGRGSMGGRG